MSKRNMEVCCKNKLYLIFTSELICFLVLPVVSFIVLMSIIIIFVTILHFQCYRLQFPSFPLFSPILSIYL
jgi:hypothetical protein